MRGYTKRHIKDVMLLRRIYSERGTIYESEINNTVAYEVRSLRDITNIILPHFLSREGIPFNNSLQKESRLPSTRC